MKRVLRSWLSHLTPPTWRLPIRFYWHRLRGGEETKQWQSELEQLRRWSSSDATAIDVGANEGLYSYKFAQWFGTVESFEPNPLLAQRLRSYRSQKIHIHEIAISASEGHARLYVPVTTRGVDYHGWGTLDPTKLEGFQEQRAISVSVRTLDSFEFACVGVIKIDVEGHESEVLAGAIDTIRRCRPILLIEIKSASRPFVNEFFQSLGYGFYFWNLTRFIKLDTRITAWNNSTENLFAIPKEKSDSIVASAGANSFASGTEFLVSANQ